MINKNIFSVGDRVRVVSLKGGYPKSMADKKATVESFVFDLINIKFDTPIVADNGVLWNFFINPRNIAKITNTGIANEKKA